MASGPSKEDLKMYWETSRPYFDELANYYKTADPQYYNEYIAPFYSNLLYSVASPKKGSRGGASIAVVFIAIFGLLIAGIAAALVFLLADGESDSDKEEKTPPKIERKTENQQKIQQKNKDSITAPQPEEPPTPVNPKDRNRKQPIQRVR